MMAFFSYRLHMFMSLVSVTEQLYFLTTSGLCPMVLKQNDKVLAVVSVPKIGSKIRSTVIFLHYK